MRDCACHEQDVSMPGRGNERDAKAFHIVECIREVVYLDLGRVVAACIQFTDCKAAPEPCVDLLFDLLPELLDLIFG
jgi:hypothetical protein